VNSICQQTVGRTPILRIELGWFALGRPQIPPVKVSMISPSATFAFIPYQVGDLGDQAL